MPSKLATIERVLMYDQVLNQAVGDKLPQAPGAIHFWPADWCPQLHLRGPVSDLMLASNT